MYLVAFHVVFKILALLLPLFIYSFIIIFNIKSEIIIDYRGQILPPLKTAARSRPPPRYETGL